MKKKEKKDTEKKYIRIGRLQVERNLILLLVVIEVMGLALAVSDYRNGEKNFSGTLIRPSYSERDKEEPLVVSDGEADREVSVHVTKQALSQEAAMEKLKQAQEEISATVAGENPSLDSVTKPLDTRGEYAQGTVEASWSFSDPSLIAQDGSVNLEKVKEAVIVYATAALSCSGYESVYSFPVQVVLPEAGSPEGFTYYLSQALLDADENGREEELMVLPQRVGEAEVSWKRQRNYRGQELMLLGVLTAVAILFGQREEKRRERLRRADALEADYPELVSTLSLYISAGISVKSAFERIATQYKSRAPDERGSPLHPGYDAIVIALREMEDGVSETQAYRKFGQRCDHRLYGKLSMMLAQNVKKGSRQLAEQLEKEEAECFEARKARARILGEEASTKLLVPMGMMLGVVLIVTIAPALMNMSF